MLYRVAKETRALWFKMWAGIQNIKFYRSSTEISGAELSYDGGNLHFLEQQARLEFWMYVVDPTAKRHQ